jgi:hypothetical protein
MYHETRPLTVRTIRLTIGKRRLMKPKHPRDARDVIKATPLQAPRGNQARTPAFTGARPLT